MLSLVYKVFNWMSDANKTFFLWDEENWKFYVQCCGKYTKRIMGNSVTENILIAVFFVVVAVTGNWTCNTFSLSLYN